jgi:hypothetical protein
MLLDINLPDISVGTILVLVSKMDKVTLVLKAVTFSVIEGMTAVIVGDDVGAAVGLLTVIKLQGFNLTLAEVTATKDADNFFREVRNNPVPTAVFILVPRLEQP